MGAGWGTTPFEHPRLIQRGRLDPHRRVPSILPKERGSWIESFHSTERERFKVMRGVDNEPGSAVLAEGLRVHYNLVRDHQVLGMTPGEAAGIPLGDNFRWKRILELASRSRNVTKKTREV